MLLMLGSLVGAVLGMRFKVLVLVPITALGWAVVALIAIIQNESVPSALLAMLLLSVSLQLGYLAGVGLRFLTIAARAQRTRPVTVPASIMRPNT